jgi:hypothetical protein
MSSPALCISTNLFQPITSGFVIEFLMQHNWQMVSARPWHLIGQSGEIVRGAFVYLKNPAKSKQLKKQQRLPTIIQKIDLPGRLEAHAYRKRHYYSEIRFYL